MPDNGRQHQILGRQRTESRDLLILCDLLRRGRGFVAHRRQLHIQDLGAQADHGFGKVRVGNSDRVIVLECSEFSRKLRNDIRCTEVEVFEQKRYDIPSKAKCGLDLKTQPISRFRTTIESGWSEQDEEVCTRASIFSKITRSNLPEAIPL